MKNACLNPDCTRSPFCRGLCRGCYGTAVRLIRQGVTTWKRLIKNGKALDLRKPQRPKHYAREWLSS